MAARFTTRSGGSFELNVENKDNFFCDLFSAEGKLIVRETGASPTEVHTKAKKRLVDLGLTEAEAETLLGEDSFYTDK